MYRKRMEKKQLKKQKKSMILSRRQQVPEGEIRK